MESETMKHSLAYIRSTLADMSVKIRVLEMLIWKLYPPTQDEIRSQFGSVANYDKLSLPLRRYTADEIVSPDLKTEIDNIGDSVEALSKLLNHSVDYLNKKLK